MATNSLLTTHSGTSQLVEQTPSHRSRVFRKLNFFTRIKSLNCHRQRLVGARCAPGGHIGIMLAFTVSVVIMIYYSLSVDWHMENVSPQITFLPQIVVNVPSVDENYTGKGNWTREFNCVECKVLMWRNIFVHLHDT